MRQYIVCLGPVATSATTVANEGDTIELSDSDGEQLQRWGVVRPVEGEPMPVEGDAPPSGEETPPDAPPAEEDVSPAPKEGKGKR
jgi:hypothetical protein